MEAEMCDPQEDLRHLNSSGLLLPFGVAALSLMRQDGAPPSKKPGGASPPSSIPIFQGCAICRAFGQTSLESPQSFVDLIASIVSGRVSSLLSLSRH